ncbi:hypothetical protein MMC06_004866 [Schaereria dolodes]|nr:hypothetical protein [Schaereria dolodes]
MASDDDKENRKPFRDHRRSASLFDNIVFVEIGPEKTRFGIHRGLLCEYSAYFRAALRGNFQEATEGVVRLPGVMTEIFHLVNGWLYTQQIADEPDEEDPHYDQKLAFVYICADRLDMPKLRNDAIDALIRRVERNECLEMGVIGLAYTWTPVSSPLRMLVVDMMAHLFDVVDADKENECLSQEFLVDVILEMYRVRSYPEETWDDFKETRYRVPDVVAAARGRGGGCSSSSAICG